MMNVAMLKKSQLPRGAYGLLPVKTNSAGTKLGEQSRALSSLTRCFGNAQLIGKIVMLGLLVASGQLYAEGADQALFINADGKVGIGTDKPKAQLDIQAGNRSGTQPASAIGLYVTGDFAPDKGVEFRHSNETEGIGFGHNTIYATGSNATQNLNLKPRGAGSVTVQGPLKVEGRIQDKTGDVMPVGSIIAFAGKSAPAGWLFCDGQRIPQEEKFKELKDVLDADVVPNLSGRTLIGAGQGTGLSGRTLAQQDGAEKHTLLENELAEHHHFGWGESKENNWGPNGTSTTVIKKSNGDYLGSGSNDYDNYLYASTKTGKSEPFSIMQPYHVVNYIIKY